MDMVIAFIVGFVVVSALTSLHRIANAVEGNEKEKKSFLKTFKEVLFEDPVFRKPKK